MPRRSATGSSTCGVVASVVYVASWSRLKVAEAESPSTPFTERTEKYTPAVAVYVRSATMLLTPAPASDNRRMAATHHLRRRSAVRNLCRVILLPRTGRAGLLAFLITHARLRMPHQGMLSTFWSDVFSGRSTPRDDRSSSRARASVGRVTSDWVNTARPAMNQV